MQSMPRFRPLRVTFILPALTEATSPYWRPIKYALFPPLGLATLAAYLRPDEEAAIVDEHVERLTIDDTPDLVVIVTRGCPQHCDFCYKDAFYEGGRSFYTQRVDAALAEIARLPGRHLYFLDDHLLGDARFARSLFDGMKGMNRLFQGAATVDSVLRGDLIERAAEAGLRSLFVGFETLTPGNLRRSHKRQNLGRDYSAVTARLHGLGIMINGSFVFGMDDDDGGVFRRTVDWAIENGITTATFHIQTPYPGTGLHARLARERRLTSDNWDLYDTRHVVFRPVRLTPEALKAGYDRAYREFYRWSSVAAAAFTHGTRKHQAKHFAYAAGWKKFERLWGVVIRARQLGAMTPLLEAVLAKEDGGCAEPVGSRVLGFSGSRVLGFCLSQKERATAIAALQKEQRRRRL